MALQLTRNQARVLRALAAWDRPVPPTARELAVSAGVSRGSVGDAMTALSKLGLVLRAVPRAARASTPSDLGRRVASGEEPHVIVKRRTMCPARPSDVSELQPEPDALQTE